MTEAGKRLLDGVKEAVAIAKGEQPAAAIWINGHRYVPESALLEAKQRKQADIDRLNAVITRMQQTMSSQAEQWSRSMDSAYNRGLEDAAKVAESRVRNRAATGSSDRLCANIAAAIRSKIEVQK